MGAGVPHAPGGASITFHRISFRDGFSLCRDDFFYVVVKIQKCHCVPCFLFICQQAISIFLPFYKLPVNLILTSV